MKFGIIICSRSKSDRIPEKAFLKIAGKTVLRNLVDRLKLTGIPIFIGVPDEDYQRYHQEFPDCAVYSGYADCPLRRMVSCAQFADIDAIIRITHDKILVDPEIIKKARVSFFDHQLDYLYSSMLPDGSGFEIISKRALLKAACNCEEITVEHISYAIRNLKNIRVLNFAPPIGFDNHPYRFLIDYPKDVTFMKALFGSNPDLTLQEAIKILQEKPWLSNLNRLPLVTVYTCAYNAVNYIGRAIYSVFNQRFVDFEYIIINDASTDDTLQYILGNPFAGNIKLINNDSNIGLAASSNKALKHAQGKYIVRLDADDFFLKHDSLAQLFFYSNQEALDIVYPSYIDERSKSIVSGEKNHHVGGALFRKGALDFIKFNDQLRHYDGLDLFIRAQKSDLRIGYSSDEAFYYSDTPNSMSNSDKEIRKSIKSNILKLVRDDPKNL